VWGNLALQRTATSAGNFSTHTGSFSDIRAGDILQYRDVVFSNGASASHHTAIVEQNLGNGRLQVLEQNSAGRHFVTRGTIDMMQMTAGTIWDYHPVSK
jgi:hypothetical protein